MSNTYIRLSDRYVWRDSDGRAHNTEGPAVVWDDGFKWWAIDGNEIRTAKQFQEATGHSDEKMAELLMSYGKIGL